MTDATQYKQRLSALRKAMEKQNLDGFLVPRADEWLGEFVAPYAERLKWATGFTGSAGIAVILKDSAVLLTDSRYTLQAKQQLDQTMFDIVDIGEVSLEKWLFKNTKKGAVIGFDPWLHTQEQLGKMIDKKIVLKSVSKNLIDLIWLDQPDRPATTIHNFPEEIAGDSFHQKRNQVSWLMKEVGVRWYILTQPDSIAWFLNIRASDIACIPQALSYLLIGDQGDLIWFVEPDRISRDVIDKLGKAVSVVKPDDMAEYFATLRGAESDVSYGIDFKRAPAWFKYYFAEMGKEIIDIKDPCLFPKSLKTYQEQEAIRAAHVLDGVAMVRFLKWLDEEASGGMLTEISAAEKLESFRSLSPVYCGASFPTISGFGANGAVVHYRATEKTDAAIVGDGLLLIDSGGQYHYGTTDITRTIAIGTPSQEMKENFTRVLQGHIAVASARFEDGTSGKEIDALARKPLQDAGLDYGHGTGHGVGCFLAVHEHAANLSPKGDEAPKPGMLLSNEPGYYKEGEYGIRIENLVLCGFEKEYDAQNMLEESSQESLEYIFETVTLAPIDLNLVVLEMLSREERRWLNAYHLEVKEKLFALLDEEERAWLEEATKAV